MKACPSPQMGQLQSVITALDLLVHPVSLQQFSPYLILLSFFSCSCLSQLDFLILHVILYGMMCSSLNPLKTTHKVALITKTLLWATMAQCFWECSDEMHGPQHSLSKKQGSWGDYPATPGTVTSWHFLPTSWQGLLSESMTAAGSHQLVGHCLRWLSWRTWGSGSKSPAGSDNPLNNP